MSDNPHVSLVAIVYRVWIRVPWCKSVVDTENRHVYLIGPLPQIALVSSAVLAEEASTMKVNDDLVASLDSLLGVVYLLRFKVDF